MSIPSKTKALVLAEKPTGEVTDKVRVLAASRSARRS